MLIYRHFESKLDLYNAALDDVRDRLRRGGRGRVELERIDGLVEIAQSDPDGIRLLFRQAAREPEFRRFTDDRARRMAAATREHLPATGRFADPHLRDWAARITPTVIIEAVLAWVDAGCPDPERAGDTIRAMVHGVVQSIRAPGRPPTRRSG